MTDIDTKEGNFDCVFYTKRRNTPNCVALDRAYCRENLNCAFYKQHDFYTEVPHKIVNNKVVRIHDFQDIIRYKEK